MYPHYSPITNNGKSNLLPIVYPELINMGFNKELRREIVDNYIAKYQIKDLNSVYFVPNDFETHYLKKLEFFSDLAHAHSVDTIVRDYLKDKQRSMSSENFWGLTRIAAALVEGADERIIQAIAYYDCIARELKITGSSLDAAHARKSFITLMQQRRLFRGLMIAKSDDEKIRVIIQNQEKLLDISGYSSVAAQEQAMLENFSEWYLMTEDDHVATVLIGLHALIKLKDVLVDYQSWLREFWLQGQVYCMLTKKSVLWKKSEIVPWTRLKIEAERLRNLTDIKLFSVLEDFSKLYKIEFLRRAAQIVIESSQNG